MVTRCIRFSKDIRTSICNILHHADLSTPHSHQYLNLIPNIRTTHGNARLFSASCKPVVRPRFGIVAALASDGVIGINGGLPWTEPIPQDRDHFVNLTRNKVLIVGRKTFAEEDPTGAHISHVRVCIVVSRTMDASDLVARNDEGDIASQSPELKLASSFNEALDLASQLSDTAATGESQNSNDTINCWVGGGQYIYQEALQHDNATEVHLTHVDMKADITEKNAVAYFPVEHLKRHGFEEVSRVDSGICSFSLYKRQPQDK